MNEWIDSLDNYDNTTTLYPTYSPTFGPSSELAVDLIFICTIGGVFIVSVLYFMFGYYTYSKEMSYKLNQIIEEAKDNRTKHRIASEDTPLLASEL